MAALKIYGVPRSRTVRVLWLAEELGIPYENIPQTMQNGANRQPEFMAITPNGRLPAIEDNGFKLSESLAINLYLAKKAGKFYPSSPEQEALSWQWSMWTVFEVDKQTTDWANHDHVLPPEKRDPAKLKDVREAMELPLGVLQKVLSKQDYLVTPDAFSVADLNVASALYRLNWMDLSSKPALERWFRACWDRPAAKKARAMRES
jgi:glutathione S-transferase